MSDREWQIGLCGTFDVENYGDLLFPLVAEAELTERLGAVKLHRFSYHAKTPPGWPYLVTSAAELPRMAGRLDGMLIGGGFIIRFDKDVAPGYGPPTPAIHHPTGYWLTPALIALQHGIPLIWNAPGMHCNEIPTWADPLMKLAFALSRYIAVRDGPSRAALARFTDIARIAVVPDTAFGVARLLGKQPSIESSRLREASGLTGPYIIVQAALGLDAFLRFIKNQAHWLRDFRFLALPIGPVLGDHSAILGTDRPELVCLDTWPHPLLLAELIRQSEAVVGHSYHLAITALASGVPVFTPQNLSTGKYSALLGFETIFPLAKDCEPDPQWFMARVGRTAPSAAARATLGQLAQHWDGIAAVLRDGATATQPPLNRFWQSLPSILEDAANTAARHAAAVEALERERAERQGRIDELERLLALARAELAAPDDRSEASHHAIPWTRKPRERGKRTMINLRHLAQRKLDTEPYRWAAIDRLFSPSDAAALAASFPRDHFKLVAGYGGEKDYEYEARALIGMGADTVSRPAELSKAWRSLAHDLLSPAYRTAMSLLTACDLTTALLEVNVFHYGPGASLGPHPDLADKIVTHVLYFNRSWNREHGGCLTILGSADPTDVVAEIAPVVGHSAVLVRSENSWHAVSRVVNDCDRSRRSLTATFYRAGSVSTMWPLDDTTPLHRYDGTDPDMETPRPDHSWARWRSRFASWRR